MKLTLDMIGKKFGRVTVLSKSDRKAYGTLSVWNCKCECGNECEVIGSLLVRGQTKSCGCFRREQSRLKALKYNPRVDETGKQYGNLTVIREDSRDPNGAALWLCECKCGQQVTLRGERLRHQGRTGCGKIKCRLGFDIVSEAEPVQSAYFSGHFDGEGCIRFQDHKTNPYPIAIVSACFKPILLEYQSVFGGYVSKREVSDNRRTQWIWRLCRQQGLISFIRQILPFSREKKSQLELALHYLEQRVEGRANVLPEGLRSQGIIMAQQMTILKKQEYAN